MNGLNILCIIIMCEFVGNLKNVHDVVLFLECSSMACQIIDRRKWMGQSLSDKRKEKSSAVVQVKSSASTCPELVSHVCDVRVTVVVAANTQ